MFQAIAPVGLASNAVIPTGSRTSRTWPSPLMVGPAKPCTARRYEGINDWSPWRPDERFLRPDSHLSGTPIGKAGKGLTPAPRLHSRKVIILGQGPDGWVESVGESSANVEGWNGASITISSRRFCARPCGV